MYTAYALAQILDLGPALLKQLQDVLVDMAVRGPPSLRNVSFLLLLRVMRYVCCACIRCEKFSFRLCFSPQHELVMALQRVRLLTHNESITLYRRIKREVSLLEGIVSAGGATEDPAAVVPAIDQFSLLLEANAHMDKSGRQLVQHALLSVVRDFTLSDRGPNCAYARPHTVLF